MNEAEADRKAEGIVYLLRKEFAFDAPYGFINQLVESVAKALLDVARERDKEVEQWKDRIRAGYHLCNEKDVEIDDLRARLEAIQTEHSHCYESLHSANLQSDSLLNGVLMLKQEINRLQIYLEAAEKRAMDGEIAGLKWVLDDCDWHSVTKNVEICVRARISQLESQSAIVAKGKGEP